MSITVELRTRSMACVEYSVGVCANSPNRPRLIIGGAAMRARLPRKERRETTKTTQVEVTGYHTPFRPMGNTGENETKLTKAETNRVRGVSLPRRGSIKPCQ